MNTTTVTRDKPSHALKRRQAGKVWWRTMIDEIISSEKEDLKDLQVLRNRLTNDPQSLRLIAAIQERKTERIIYLHELMNYSDKEPVVTAKVEYVEPLYPGRDV